MRTVLLCLLLLALVLPGAAAKGQTIDIVAGTNPDGTMYFTPAEPSVTKGDAVTIAVKNVDATVFHDLAILNYNGDRQHLEWEVAGGKTTTRTFTAANAGTFEMICEVSGHAAKGMKGHFTVKASSGLPGPELAPVLVCLMAALLLVRRR